MRLGRLIVLAGLAPLIGLPALAAILSEAASAHSTARHQSQLTLDTPASDFASIVVSPERTSRLAVLALTVLADTPLRHSLWMMQGPAVSPLPARVPLLRQLRC